MCYGLSILPEQVASLPYKTKENINKQLKYNMKVKELKDLNNKKDNALKVGEELKVKNSK